MKRKLVFGILLILSTSCNKLQSDLQGGWLIEKAYCNNKPCKLDLYTNSFDLNEDHTCILPISAEKERHTDIEKGIWKSYTENDISYLEINTTNKFFNKKFKVLNFRKELDYKQSGYLLKVTFVSDSIKIECAKVPYY